jgi:hypothetical protein
MRVRRYVLAGTVGGALWVVAGGVAHAYPEYQKFAQTNSGRVTNCAMCHVHPDGPEGAGHGQIGSLKADGLTRLGAARAAFEPGADVDSPILNGFGNTIIRTVGKSKVIELRSRPGDLAAMLDPASDLDGDGIPDAREYVEGTQPLQAGSGDPWSLFVTNLRRSGFHVGAILVASILTMFGLAKLLRGWHVATEARLGPDEHRET